MHDRRHFISTLLGASVAGFAAAQSSGLSANGENMQFGLVTYMWGADWDVPTLIENCSEAGVSAVELRVEHAHKVEPTLNKKQRNEVKQIFEESRILPIGMGTNCEFHSTNAEEVKANIEKAKEYIKLSHDIGGTGVKVKPNALPKEVPTEKTLEQIGKALAELGEFALGFGQEIRLEVHGGVTDLGHIRTIMQTAALDNVRVCWNSNPADLKGEGIEANFAKVKEYLGSTVHVRELDTPDYPFDKLIKLLVDTDYAGWVLLEASSKPDDRVTALGRQKELFTRLVTNARKTGA